MYYPETVKELYKLNEEVTRQKGISVVPNVTQRQVLDNYYHVKRLIGKVVERLKEKMTANS